MKKYLLLTALVGSMIGANAFAVAPRVAVDDGCPQNSYNAGDGFCDPCPSNYNNTYIYKNGIESCCINELTYDSASGLCVAVASSPNIASNANSATCDDNTIGATSGSTEMEALWDANTITINWYNGNTKITTNTCLYDGAVTIPATPTKAGYTFNGWHVRSAAPARVEVNNCSSINNQQDCSN